MFSFCVSVLSVCLFCLIVSHSGSARPPCLNEDCHQSPRNTRQVKTLSMKMCEKYGESVFKNIYGIDGQYVTVDQCGHKRQKRIVNGTIVRPRTFPHMAIVTSSTSEKPGPLKVSCGATLISDRFLLSAAHCISFSGDPVKYVVLGDLDYDSGIDEARPVWKEIKEVFTHPDYNRRFIYNDIGLIELKETVEFNAFIRPICLSSDQNLPKSATIAGWGSNFVFDGRANTVLREGRVEIKPIDECRKIYNNTKRLPIQLLSSTHICALGSNGEDPCQGDSGAPLQVRLVQPYCMDKQIGIISMGKSCGMVPSVYTRTAQYVPWIESIVWADEDNFRFTTKIENMVLSTE